ncbi:S8 family serine peptidase [Pseudomonas sp. R5(2019)]|uniref:subtilisin-like serine protease QhpE n=1 Tax=Pseudomonas sp. R5(2019) TaxID=2697566 RepID=UPI0014136A8E|nr:S8 family serine peptidase [Pseudomonas sp. R5(2019)]NBA94980.1 S8 family serine peptidase [Pseudomonas sp. R5(2019)]
MRPDLRIGIVDSGYTPSQGVAAAQRFWLVEAGLAQGDVEPDSLGHGSAVLAAIAQRAPEAELYVAQVFDGRGVTSALQVAAGIDWLVNCGVRVINLSLGLRHDREALRLACAAAQASGVLLCASSPAQGAGVFPASYPGVVRVTGDARCGPQQWSWLNSAQADFGACVRGDRPGQSGASLGCAALCGHIAERLLQAPEASNEAVLRWLVEHASYRGIERRAGP